MDKMTYEEFADEYLSGDVGRNFNKNLIVHRRAGGGIKTFSSPYRFIDCAFPWSETAEGNSYWSEVSNNLYKDPKFYLKKNQSYREFAKKYLSGDIYCKFVENCINMNNRGFIDKPSPANLADSDDYFYGSFVWDKSPEGHAYWSKAAAHFRANKDCFKFIPYVWVVFSEGSMKALDAFNTEEEAKQAWDGCDAYVIKKYIQLGE